MKSIKSVLSVSLVCFTLTVLSGNVYAEIVKKSNSDICHDSSSGSYSRTKNFTSYNTIKDCLDSGGRLPKGVTAPIDKAVKEAEYEGRDYVTLYNRKDWPHWIDADRDCQDTREEMLISTSSTTVKYKDGSNCSVYSGSWYGAYSGETFTVPKEMDLDHIIPLKYAHDHGGYAWSKDVRTSFANDPENLLLVSLSLNRQKGAKGPTEWMPPKQSYRCEYLSSFDKVMDKYHLKYTSGEIRVVNKMKSACNL